MTHDITRIEKAILIVLGMGAAVVAVTDVGRPAFSGQPALVNHAAYGVDGPTGFDQAQGGR